MKKILNFIILLITLNLSAQSKKIPGQIPAKVPEYLAYTIDSELVKTKSGRSIEKKLKVGSGDEHFKNFITYDEGIDVIEICIEDDCTTYMVAKSYYADSKKSAVVVELLRKEVPPITLIIDANRYKIIMKTEGKQRVFLGDDIPFMESKAGI